MQEEKDNQNREKGITAGGKRPQKQPDVNVPGADQDPLQLCRDTEIRDLF